MVMGARVIIDSFIAFTRVSMDHNFDQRRELVEQRVAYLFGDEMAFQHGLFAVHRDVHLTPQAVAHPAHRRSMHIHDTLYTRGRVFEFFIDLRIDGIHHAVPHIARRFPDDAQDRNPNPEPDEWIKDRESQPDANGPRQNG